MYRYIDIKSNYNKRELLKFHELTDKEKRENDLNDDTLFIKFKNKVYSLNELETIDHRYSIVPSYWQLIYRITIDKGLVFRLESNDDDTVKVIVGTYINHY